MDYVPSARLNRLLRQVPAARLKAADADIRAEARRRDVYFHYRPDERRYIPIALKPWIVTAAQRSYLHRVSMAAQSAALRVFPLWWERRDLQALMPLSDAERRWMRDAYRGQWRRPETLMARADIAVHLGEADWRSSMRLLEINLVGIGATYYCWCAGRITYDVLAPLVARTARPEDDLLDMILGRCVAHGAKIGRPKPTVALVEYRRANEGPFEYETMARIYRERGHRVVVADPIELSVRRGEIVCGDERIDVLYRDPTLADLVLMEEMKDDLRAVKLAFRRNQVVSSLGGELDHKALLELFSSARHARMFTSTERALLRRHVPWTRVLRAERVDGVDLPEFARKRRDELIIKPNRDYGGKDIRIGERMTAARWDAAIDEAVRASPQWVVQERVRFNRDDYPILTNGRVRWEARYIVTGVHATPDGTAILGRMSEEPVVNITRGGAIVGVLTGAAKS